MRSSVVAESRRANLQMKETYERTNEQKAETKFVDLVQSPTFDGNTWLVAGGPPIIII